MCVTLFWFKWHILKNNGTFCLHAAVEEEIPFIDLTQIPVTPDPVTPNVGPRPIIRTPGGQRGTKSVRFVAGVTGVVGSLGSWDHRGHGVTGIVRLH